MLLWISAEFGYYATVKVLCNERIDKRTPQFGMRFRDSGEAWVFWVEYGGHIGFDVRKRCTNLSKLDGKVTSRKIVCSNEGIRKRKGQTYHEPLELKQDPIVKFRWLLHLTEQYKIMKLLMLCWNATTTFDCHKTTTCWHHKGIFHNYELSR